jgi:hypothetical protein
MNPFFGSLPMFVSQPIPTRVAPRRPAADAGNSLGWVILAETTAFAVIALLGEALAFAQ